MTETISRKRRLLRFDALQENRVRIVAVVGLFDKGRQALFVIYDERKSASNFESRFVLSP